ncbi:MAG: T9SS type A sorting domain-containing protein [Lewinella sp.]|nr:T9SS type A sorting domain-containing protein [Lewinella sp.]
MVRTSILTLALVFTWLTASAQPTRSCGTMQGRSAWLKAYQAQPLTFARGGDTTLYVALTIHIAGTEDGVGYFRREALYDALCKLNADYAQAGIRFFIAGEILYHNNSSYYSHGSVLEGAEMMFAENVPNTLNIYFVNDPAGNCGYNLPYAGIAMKKGCSGPSDDTWAHEVGHALSLPHPFLGWEGGVSWDGSVAHDFSNPAPERVTYDYTYFQDTLILDTMIIDTAYVERVDGSNCAFAADGFCDTTPDYMAGRWTCNEDGLSPTVQTDPNGETFRSDGSYIMGYANDPCQAIFTPGQIGAMRAFLLNERDEWLYDQTPAVYLSGPAQMTGPETATLHPANQVTLSWTAVAGAEGYLVEVSRLSSFVGGLTDELVTTDTSLLVPDLDPNRTYYWRVRPYNRYDGCQGFEEVRNFQTDAAVNTAEPGQAVQWRVFPNPVQAGLVHIQLNTGQTGPAELSLFDALGRPVLRQIATLVNDQADINLDVGHLPAGWYTLRWQAAGLSSTHKLIIQP